jgi:hypothetical protein
MDAKNTLERLFFANTTVLISHQIDAAYWKEWNMFNLPGGIQVFVLLNIPILFAVLMGYRSVLFAYKSALVYTLLLAGSGLFASVFHGFHLANDDERFNTPVSIVLLFFTFIISVAQVTNCILISRAKKLKIAAT